MEGIKFEEFFETFTDEQRSRMNDKDMYDLVRTLEADYMRRGERPITHIGQMYEWHPEFLTEEERQAEELYRVSWKYGWPPIWWKEIIDSGDRSIPWRSGYLRGTA